MNGKPPQLTDAEWEIVRAGLDESARQWGNSYAALELLLAKLRECAPPEGEN
jgi:hypothetical protein